MVYQRITRALLLCAGFLSLLSAQANAAPTWKQILLPSALVSNGGNLFPLSDGNVFAVSASGVSGGYITSIYRAPLSAITAGSPKWTALGAITSSTCAHCGTEVTTTMMATPNGTIFIALSNGRGFSDVLYWNGSTSSPSWSTVTGYSGTASSFIYSFTQDSSGYTYFSPAWSGDVWRNDSVNATAFTKEVSHVYTAFGQKDGGIYAEKIMNLGKGDDWVGCGEGGVLDSDLAFTSATTYLASGYSGNCTNIAFNSSVILVTRYNKFPNDLSSINTSTLAVTNYACALPRSSTSCVSKAVNSSLGSLSFLNGSRFVWNVKETSTGTIHLLMSSTNGATWNDITPGLGANCTGSNAGLQQRQSYQPPNDIFAKCQRGQYYWVYGPV